MGGAEGEGGGVDEEVFRVRVCLERYYSDERAWCYMRVRGARPVRSLARRLRRAFRLPRPFALLASGHLLPPDEPLALLRPDDALHVIPTDWTDPAAATAEWDGRGDFAGSPPPVEHVAPPLSLPGGEDGGAALPKSPSPSPRAADLQETKQRALRLLETYEAPRRRRRRVRRRRTMGPGGEGGGPAESQCVAGSAAPVVESQCVAPPVESQCAAPPVDSQCAAPPVDSQCAAGSAVVRNGTAEARAPRLVHPLHAPATDLCQQA